MTVRNQLTQAEARVLFDYEDGKLYWRKFGSGMRSDRVAIWSGGNKGEIKIGGMKFQAHYVIWNWHHGVTGKAIRFRDGDRGNLRIENLCEVDISPSLTAPERVDCPTCGHHAAAPSLGGVMLVCELTPKQARILGAVWRGRGQPVHYEQIVAALYEDDPDGGPSHDLAYKAMKVGIHHLRKRLEGSGVGIESAGYGKGYRLVLAGRARQGEAA